MRAAFPKLGLGVGIILALLAVGLGLASMAADEVPCDNADTKLRLAATSAIAAGAAVVLLRDRRRWLYAVLAGVAVFIALWFYALATADFSCLN
jgi:hypothetical protein